MQTQTAVSAANALIQSVESALPKQKKTQAVTEFKQAMVAHKRGSKARQNEQDLVELPQDVIVHIFSFLDLRSLVSALQVCRSWNAASSDNHLWQLMFTVFYNTSSNFGKTYKLLGGLTEEAKSKLSQGNIVCNNSLDWRTSFKKVYDGFSSKKLLTSSRGFCKHCQTIFWVSDMANGTTSRLRCKYHQINPITTQQIVEYIDGEYASSESDSDTDSDSYDEFVPKLWAYPKRPGSLF
ncbi:F-box domain, cyclin-like protein [Artemisia annua]|uniref:F-box domain, cyclin-like protein n=1 Tax=Artemisia annua TaxID=35608 RepID=A0A2U1LKH3_ARTAN|nr:F-box domain, cyclin-like protein [Artemisia annua]